LEPAPSLPPPLGIDRCSALLDYDGARTLVTSLKNGGRRDLISFLAERMATLDGVDRGAVVTWAPTGAARRQARGFDQAELLARAVARRSGLPCTSMLRRHSGPAQSGRTAAERRTHPGFSAVRRCPTRVLLIDDVATTGSTLTSAARALRAAGTITVTALVMARSAGFRGTGF